MPDHNGEPFVDPERLVEVARLCNEVQRLQTQCGSTRAENSRYQSLLHRIQRVHRNAELLFWDAAVTTSVGEPALRRRRSGLACQPTRFL